MRVELAPFRAGHGRRRGCGDDRAHRVAGARRAEFSPATLSRPIVTGLLRGEMKFDGLIYTDSMGMDAVVEDALARRSGRPRHPGRQRHRAAFAGRRGGGGRHQGGGGEGRDSDGADRRVRAARPARQGAARPAQDAPCRSTTCRRRSAGARTPPSRRALSQKSITLIKDDRNQVPLRVPREASCCICRCSTTRPNWRIAAPSRTFMPELRKRWPNVTAIELSDRSTTEEIDLVRAVRVALRRHRRVGLRPRGVRRAAGWISRRRW